MRNKLRYLLCTLFLLLVACVGKDDIAVEKFNGIDLVSVSRMNMLMVVKNDSRHKVGITDAKITLRRGSRKIGELMVRDKIFASASSTGEIILPVYFKISDPFFLLSLRNGADDLLEGLTATGYASVRAGWGKKKIKFDDAPVSSIISNFGL